MFSFTNSLTLASTVHWIQVCYYSNGCTMVLLCRMLSKILCAFYPLTTCTHQSVFILIEQLELNLKNWSCLINKKIFANWEILPRKIFLHLHLYFIIKQNEVWTPACATYFGIPVQQGGGTQSLEVPSRFYSSAIPRWRLKVSLSHLLLSVRDSWKYTSLHTPCLK